MVEATLETVSETVFKASLEIFFISLPVVHAWIFSPHKFYGSTVSSEIYSNHMSIANQSFEASLEVDFEIGGNWAAAAGERLSHR